MGLQMFSEAFQGISGALQGVPGRFSGMFKGPQGGFQCSSRVLKDCRAIP